MMKKEKLLFLNNLVAGFAFLLWLGVWMSNSATYNSLTTLFILPVLGLFVVLLSIYLKQWWYLIVGLFFLFSFFITMFLGYLFLSA